MSQKSSEQDVLEEIIKPFIAASHKCMAKHNILKAVFKRF